MTRTFYCGVNRLNLLLRHISCTTLLLFHKFRCIFLQNKTDLYQVNPEYLSREQDQMLLMRLQSSLSNANLSHLVGCVHSNELWEKIHAYFHHQSQKNARQLPSDLRNSSLHNCTLLLFFLILSLLLTLFVQLEILFLLENIWIQFLHVFLKNMIMLLLLLMAKLIVLLLKKLRI